MAVQPGLCRTWLETPKTDFLRTRLITVYEVYLEHVVRSIMYMKNTVSSFNILSSVVVPKNHALITLIPPTRFPYYCCILHGDAPVIYGFIVGGTDFFISLGKS